MYYTRIRLVKTIIGFILAGVVCSTSILNSNEESLTKHLVNSGHKNTILANILRLVGAQPRVCLSITYQNFACM